MVTTEQERELNSIAENEKTVLRLGKGKVKVGWMRRGALRKFTSVMLDKREDMATQSKVTCKQAAIVVLNGYWKIKFCYWILWRWYYYIEQYLDSELLPIVEEGKKKVQAQEYFSIMMLAQELKDTLQVMTKEEVSRFLQERSSEQKEQ